MVSHLGIRAARDLPGHSGKRFGRQVEGMTHREKVITALKGLVVGGTMLVPGASGGSMAMILGVYDKLVSSVSSFLKHKRASFVFLALFAAGGLLGMIAFAKPLLALIERYPMPMHYFFLGAVAGGIPLIFREAQVKRFSWRLPVYILIGVAVVVLIGLVPVGRVQSEMEAGVLSFLLLVVAGFIAAVALVLPGISVSYLLLLMGLYDETMRAISTFYLPFLIPLGLGLVAGIVPTTKVLERAIERHPHPTYLIMLGFMLGSMAELYPGIPDWSGVPLCLFTLAAGFCIIWGISRKTS